MRLKSKARYLCVLAFAVASQSAGAQVIDFTATSGGFTGSHLSGASTANPWGYTLGAGWSVGGITQVSLERLTSPIFTSTASAFGLILTHSFSFENSLNPAIGFDGGQVRVSVNGGAFNLLTPSGTYGCTISGNFGSPIGLQAAFCGTFGPVSSTFSGNVANVGDTYQFAFDGAWDSSLADQSPNWLLTSLELRDLTSSPSTVPEPSTYALMAAGLLAIGVTARRRRAATGTATT